MVASLDCLAGAIACICSQNILLAKKKVCIFTRKAKNAFEQKRNAQFSLIGIFSLSFQKRKILTIQSEPGKDWIDWADAQADLSFLWTQICPKLS